MDLAALSVSEIINGIPKIGNFTSNLRKSFINRNGFLHVCFYEIRLNIDIISAFKYENFTTDLIKTDAFLELINSFEITALKALLTGYDRRKYRRLVNLLNRHWFKNNKTIDITDDTVEDNDVNGKGKKSNDIKTVKKNEVISINKVGKRYFCHQCKGVNNRRFIRQKGSVIGAFSAFASSARGKLESIPR